MNKLNYIDIILIISFMYPILRGFAKKFSSITLKRDIYSFESSINALTSLFSGIYFGRIIYVEHELTLNALILALPEYFKEYFTRNRLILYITVVLLLLLLTNLFLKILFHILNVNVLYKIFDSLEEKLKERNNGLKRVTGAIVNLPKGIFYLIVIVVIINIYTRISFSRELNLYSKQSFIYREVCERIVAPAINSSIAKELPKVLNNSMKIVIKQSSKGNNSLGKIDYGNTIVYYNGVTMEEGIKSDENINNFARRLTSGEINSKIKANIMYNWVGKNIRYDYEKADRILKNDFSLKSGAINTFYSKKGICFDYSCLFAAMCRANNLRVRIITGKGFDGLSWLNHAWNQVYIAEEKKWINVDTTFYDYSNYFDSNNFELDHSDGKIAGEW